MYLPNKNKIIFHNIANRYQCIRRKIGKKNSMLKIIKITIQKVFKKYKKNEISSFIIFIEEYKMIPIPKKKTKLNIEEII